MDNRVLIGLFGGTFDPIHLGHTHAAESVAEKLSLSHIRMVLSARPGHRTSPSGEIAHRWNMLCLACEESSRLVPDDAELTRQGRSYTICTLRDIRSEHPEVIPCWIMGQDAFATLPIWHEWQSLLDYANLVVTDRPGDRRAEPTEVQQLCECSEVSTLDPARIGQIIRLDLPMQEVSATQIRSRIRTGQPVDDLLAAPVSAYIRKHQLYTTKQEHIN